ncbi:MAG: hypothetical protein K1X78_04255 [Verrucomicrobiaceae bacterium]|nr:hypothetical protein [Verrucomicrobiaceae bacterium]
MTGWRECIEQHRLKVAPYADAYVERRSRGARHPVHDFLFTYYGFAPAKLKQWLPPSGVWLDGVTDVDLAASPWLGAGKMTCSGARCGLDVSRLDLRMRGTARWIATLCRAILDRPPRFRCYGLHEWAMVYRQSDAEIRHQGWRLRLPPDELARFVESQSLCCTHYDAFRFFTPAARPLNAFAPTLDSRSDLEQPACLHANMDIYKWATKLWPWCGSDLIAEAFLLALAGRDLDMRASPYDLRDLGCAPVRIETAEGREEYESLQREIAARSRPVRERLLEAAVRIAETP